MTVWGGIISFVLVGMVATASVAQEISQNDQTAIDAAIQQQKVSEVQHAQTKRTAQGDTNQSNVPPPDPFSVPAGGPCFNITDVVITGYEAFGSKPDGISEIVGTCVTALDAGNMLNRINTYYQDKGYITTRAYLPEQDISDGVIEVTVVPGRLEGFIYSDGTQADRRLNLAFPAERGDLVNLRDIEQGLENINAPKSVNANFEMVPGENVGGSFVAIKAESDERWHFDINADTSGFETTGEIKAASNLKIDNIFNANDQLVVNFVTTPFVNRKKRYSDSLAFNFSVPVGNWSYGFDLGGNRYFFTQQGINQSYPVNGRSHYKTFSAERMLLRDQTNKIYGYGELKLTRTRTFIENVEIESQRRRLTFGTLGMRGEHTLDPGKFSWDLAWVLGLDAFNSYVLSKSIVDTEFRLGKLQLNYEHPFGDSGVTYKGMLSLQHSNDVLPSTQQFSIGGWSSVRGFHDDSMYGDTGFYLVNTVEWDGHKNDNFEIKWHAGLDYGQVEASELRSWSQDYLVGAELGANIKFKSNSTLTLKIGHALSRPDENVPHANLPFEANRTVFFVGVKHEF